MNFEEYRLMIPPYLADLLTPAEHMRFEEELAVTPALREELEELRTFWAGLDLLPKEQPSPALRARFYQALQSLDKPSRPPKRNFFAGWSLLPAQQLGLAAVVFLLGLFAGHASNTARVSEEVSELHGEVQNMRQVVALALLDRQSANARLEGVSWGSRVERPDRQVSSALLTALNHDPNVNVRLSSVDALQKFAADPAIRKALLDSIGTQESPLVQISLIDALVQMRDGRVSTELRNIERNQQYDRNVRQRAQWGIQKLGLE